MYSRNFKILQSLPAKLTFYYASIFIISTFLVLTIVYFLAQKILFQIAIREIFEDVHEIESAYHFDGLKGLKKAAQIELNLKGSQNIFIRLFRGNGEIIYETDPNPLGKKTLPDLKKLKQVQKIRIPQGARALQIVFPLDSDKFCEVINSLSKEEKLLSRLRSILVWSALLSVLLSLYGGWFMARRSCAHISEITHIAQEITRKGDFSKRIPLKGTGDELDRLAKVLNGMLARIQSLFSEMEQVVDNLAHDLRTPLARIRMLASSALEEKDIETISPLQVEIMEECDRLMSLINNLLDISEAKSGLLKLKLERVPLKEILAELEELFLPVAQTKGIDLRINPIDITLEADKFRLRQALANLLDNALKYTNPPGQVEICASCKANEVIIEVRDTGPGIPHREIPQIFKKFYRLDHSRSSSGRGIGLSLARAYVEAHGGRIEVESKPQKGSIFRIIIPKKSVSC